MATQTSNLIEEVATTDLELTVGAEESQLSRVRDFVEKVCDEAGFSQREANNTKLAVDEACTNIIKHAYDDGSGEITIKAEVGTSKLEIAIIDTGKPFDFGSVDEPDLQQYVESGKKGGLGIFLINRLMDGVEYRTYEDGNELRLTKRSRLEVARGTATEIGWRSTLRYKFTLRANIGLFVLIAAIWGSIFIRQSSTIDDQLVSRWMDRGRLAASLADNSKELLLNPVAFSVQQTNLTALITKVVSANDDVAYVRVVDAQGVIVSSGDIDEIFATYEPPAGDVLLQESSHATWTRHEHRGQLVRNIDHPVRVKSEGTFVELGRVHLGVFEKALARSIPDPRLATSLFILAIYLVGVLLIGLLVSVFVKPIQVLTDGVRAIRQGTLDGKISVEGPAEIGAIAAVFNEITDKFKRAQASILEQEKMQKEMEVAKEIQQSLLPGDPPDISGYDIAPLYQAAKEVGGDYYDFVDVDDDIVGVVVADVSGKGVPGSLVMTMIRTALRMEARGNRNASDVMAKMNDFVSDDMKRGMFVTMFYVILDSKNRIINYASAGHNPMILYRAETNETYFLNPRGFPVGISLPDESLFRKSIDLEKIKLKKDDMLVIYTDGVTEAMNRSRQQYGEDRLVSVIKEFGHLHPKLFINELERDIRSFTGGMPQNDDITIVAVKEKLAADDVLFGIRKRLIEMVEVEGMTVREACRRMKVSPATYYRYKRRRAALGERGLKNKVLRQDVDLKRVSVEDRKKILEMVRSHPDWGAKRIAKEFNGRSGAQKQMTERMVYDELRRIGLNTRERRLEYLRRYGLVEKEEASGVPGTPDRDAVEALIEEIAEGRAEPRGPQAAKMAKASGASGPQDPDRSDERGGLEAEATTVGERGDIAVISLRGIVDSATEKALGATLEKVLSAGICKIVVDLSAVEFVSSGGWTSFTGKLKVTRQQGGDITLFGMNEDLHQTFCALGLDKLLRHFNVMAEALEHFDRAGQEG